MTFKELGFLTAAMAFFLLGGCSAKVPADFAAPADLPPLDGDWKAKTYKQLLAESGRKPDKIKYQFFDPPQPCALAVKSKWTFSSSTAYPSGYCGMVAVRGSGFFGGGYRLELYVIDSEAKLKRRLTGNDFIFVAAQRPRLFRVEWEDKSSYLDDESDWQYTVEAVGLSSQAQADDRAFRKSGYKALPPYK